MSDAARRIALLRGINVGGHAQVAMAELRRVVTGLGFRDVRSVLNSGNLVFATGRRGNASIERLIEREVLRQLDIETDLVVRTLGDWHTAIADNPFGDAAMRDPSHLLVMFLKEAPAEGADLALRRAVTGREQVHVEGSQAYLVYPDGVGRSRLTTEVIERALGTRGTARNWNTVRKLAATAEAL